VAFRLNESFAFLSILIVGFSSPSIPGRLSTPHGCRALAIPDAPITTNPSVKGAIGKPFTRPFWLTYLKPSSKILDLVTSGYKLPFLDK
jgi:hypothetical protein